MRRKKTLLFSVLFISIVTISLFVYYNLIQQGSGYEDITVKQAKELIETAPSLVILDVRTAAEYNDEHIEGAINIPLDELQQRLAELNHADTILVYCRTGNRSTQAANLLVENGVSGFYHMRGGIVAWKQNGYPVTK